MDILILLSVICLVTILARHIKVGTTICFFIAGMALGFFPEIPFPQVPPNLILEIFLPPLLMEAAYFTSLRDFKYNARPILFLAIGLVLATTLLIAGLFTNFASSLHIETSLALGLGAVLGAIISPPDAVAATSIFKNLHVPRRIITILEGESLINDATGLILYSFAVAAVASGHFSVIDASAKFIITVIASSVLGFLLGWLYIKIFPLLKDNSIEILSSIMAPYIVYISAEHLHASGVLAVVVSGLTVSWRMPYVTSPQFRLNASSVWKMLTFVLNSAVFIIMGHQLPEILTTISSYNKHDVVHYSVVVVAATFLIRFVWVYVFTYLPRLWKPIREKDPLPHWSNVFIVSWTAMRGVVSLAIALALPFTLDNGALFPHRDLIIFLAVVVIIATLVVQGITLPFLLKKLPLSFNPALLMEDWIARHTATKNALEKIKEICHISPEHESILSRLESFYTRRLELLGDGPNTPLRPTEIPDNDKHPTLLAENKVWQDIIDVERKTVVGMRKKFEISDSVMYDIVRDLDFLANRFKA